MQTLTPRLILIGAGPGDPDLITLKAVKYLKNADVVLYDALVNTALLDYAHPDAELIFVGKRKGCYAYHQDQINDLIVDRAHARGTVVRLKGGDPFIFGRGAEELVFAAQNGITTELVPGISSGMAVPALQSIPLTLRGVSESFWVITGTTKEHRLSEDVQLAATSNATVVILMGTAKLTEIINVFKAQHKGELPVAIIQNGTRTDEKIGIGTVNTIEKVYAEKNLGNPAIIVLGAVVNHRENMQKIIASSQVQSARDSISLKPNVA